MTEPRRKVASEIPIPLADQIDDLRAPMSLPVATTVRHLLEIGVAAVLNDHRGSLATAIESLPREPQAKEPAIAGARGKK